MLLRIALMLVISVFLLSGCQSIGALAFTRPAGQDEGDDTARPGADMEADEFIEAFASKVVGNGRSLIELDESEGEELAFFIDDVSIKSEYVDGVMLHVYAPNGETESVTLAMPLPELKSEDDVAIGDEAALRSVRSFNTERARERAAFMACVEAALRASNSYKNGVSEAHMLTIMSDAEKTIVRRSEQNEVLPVATTLSFVLDVGYSPQIVFILEFIV